LTEHRQKIWDGFYAVAEAAPGDREELLDRLCGDDDAMRSEIESLLAAAERSGDFLDLSAGAVLSAAEGSDDDDAPGVGSAIGPYLLEEQLGEGGMGVVFRARQESPIRREVALKLIRTGLDSHEVIARFEAERQALALMNHPNIARVFEAGTTPDGRPYFVMELVPGAHITRYCDEHKLGIRDRISLAVTVCRAVQHAHRMGIIHRDLKPSNIIVAEIDGEAVPKVIDFGVQKATDPDGGAPALTREQRLIGTPEYMSPEQWEAQADIDTRTDVYALGWTTAKLPAGTGLARLHIHLNPDTTKTPRHLSVIMLRGRDHRKDRSSWVRVAHEREESLHGSDSGEPCAEWNEPASGLLRGPARRVVARGFRRRSTDHRHRDRQLDLDARGLGPRLETG
jgi:serine/threonine protein kinase